MARMLIHAGFHKTGTSSVQVTLDANREQLSEWLRIWLKDDVEDASEAARVYSHTPTRRNLVTFQDALAAVFSRTDAADMRDICLSCEDLVGLMPGRRDIMTYKAAPALMRATLQAAKRHLHGIDEFAFYFSLRDARPWLRSCYAQHLRVIRITDDVETYTRRYWKSADLGDIVDQVRQELHPHPVFATPIETLRHERLGPLVPIFAHFELPERVLREITVLPPANVALPPALQEEFLRLNRSNRSGAEIKASKMKLRKNYAKQLREQSPSKPPLAMKDQA